jgi:vancomycin resistance protein YoaR
MSAVRRPAVIAGGVGVVLALLAILWVSAYLLAGDRVPQGTTVRGVPIGGMTAAAAEDELRAELGPRAGEPITATVGSETVAVDPDEYGLGLDSEATVDAASGHSWNPLALWRGYFGGRETRPVVAVDEQALTAGVAALAERIDQEPVPGAVTFEAASAVAVPAQEGRVLDQEAAARELAAAYRSAEDTVELPAAITEPAVTDAEVERAMTEVAGPAVAAPVTLAVGDATVEVAPETYAPALSMAADGTGALLLQVDDAVLEERLTEALPELQQPPRDASIVIEDGNPEIVPSQQGRELEPADLVEAVRSVLTDADTDAEDREVQVEAVLTEPEFTTAEAEALGVQEVVGEFTTYYPDTEYRRVNVGRAAELVNGTLLEPGEVFSLNDVLGKRTVGNGFTEGTIILGGRLTEALGGGVSQVATTTFNAMFFAGLEEIEHEPHSFYISRYPVGREATVSWGTIDLRFRNDTDYGVLVETLHDPGQSITVRMWSTELSTVSTSTSERSNREPFETVYDSDGECIDQPGIDGFDVNVYRTVSRGGEVVTDERFFTRYLPSTEVICGPEPADAP